MIGVIIDCPPQSQQSIKTHDFSTQYIIFYLSAEVLSTFCNLYKMNTLVLCIGVTLLLAQQVRASVLPSTVLAQQARAPVLPSNVLLYSVVSELQINDDSSKKTCKDICSNLSEDQDANGWKNCASCTRGTFVTVWINKL